MNLACATVRPSWSPRTHNLRRTGNAVLRRGLMMTLAVVAVCIEISAVAQDAGQYFSDRMDEIEVTLVTPPESYGLRVTDRYANATNEALSNLGELTQTWELYVAADGKVLYRIERFDPGGVSKNPYFTYLRIADESTGDARAVTNIRGKKTVTKNLESQATGIGEVDVYLRFASAQQNDERPDKQPFQILANPCFAPLNLSPVKLRTWQVTEIETSPGLRTFEVKAPEPENPMTYRLSFDPDRSHTLVQSELIMGPGGPDEAEAYEKRTIDEWQELAGRFVPSKFSMERRQKGQVVLSLNRRIADAVVGEVLPAERFDFSTMPEFEGAVEYDAAQLAKAAKQAVSEGNHGRSKATWIIAGNLVVVLVVCGALWRHRRRAGSL